MDKRGFISLEALVKSIPHIIITMALLVVGVMVYQALFAEPPSPLEKDLARLSEQVKILQPGDYTPVFVLSKGVLDVYPADFDDKPDKCGSKGACICVTKRNPAAPIGCENFPDIVKCTNNLCKENDLDCEIEKSCVSQRAEIALNGNTETRDNIFLCKKETVITITEDISDC